MKKLIRIHSIRKSIIANLIAIFIVLNAPIYLMNVYMNSQIEQSILQRTTGSISLNASYFLKSFETEIERIDNLKNEYLNSEDFLKLANEGPFMDSYSRGELILSVKDKLHILKTSSPFVQDVKVYFPSLNRGVFASSYENSMPEEDIERIAQSYLHNSMLYELGTSLALGGVYPVPLGRNNLVYSMEVVLSGETIRHMLKEIGGIDPLKDGAAILYDPEMNWTISGCTEAAYCSELEEYPIMVGKGVTAGSYGSIDIADTRLRIIEETSQSKGIRLMVAIPENVMTGVLQRYNNMYYVILIASLILILLFSYSIYRLVHRPFKQLLAGLRRIELGDYDVVLSTRKGDEFSIVYRQFNSMAMRIKVLIQEVFEHKIRLQTAKLKQLQSQINPHFLYNSYYAIYRLAQQHDVEKVADYTRFLGDYFKYITRNASDVVPLAEEMKHAEAYIRIQMLRFSNRIRTDIDPIPSSFERIYVPKLILQPIVENAYVHGLGAKLEGGLVRMAFDNGEKHLSIVIEDNGELDDRTLQELCERLARTNDDPSKETTGVINVHKRLQLRFGKSFGLAAERSKLGGLKIAILLPGDDATDKRTKPKREETDECIPS
ncbi:histidine kinase [Paenibacillus sp. J5C_2022]|uniref:sensor histidine kinase n=1 Tax=Paenibacillus sp. J5C2022 TaxID=2977129 RepID=UPI0021D0C735|nr:histidine kinase [Paenibacillus sp. J5C2022]MCU6708065.1 histidine kinase [Paenibacillus sp. J5C2022]